VDDTVGNENVRGDDASTVDKDLSVSNGDGQVGAVYGLEGGAVGQAAAVTDSAGNNVVGKDACDLLGGEVTKTGADGLESSVAGGEDGDILGGVDGLNKVGSGKSSSEGRQTSGDGSVGSSLGDGKDSVDDVDNTAGESNILETISREIVFGHPIHLQQW